MGSGGGQERKNTLSRLAVMMGQVREANSESDLIALEDQIDALLQAELMLESNGGSGSDMSGINLAVGRLEKAIERQRAVLRAGESPSAPAMRVVGT